MGTHRFNPDQRYIVAALAPTAKDAFALFEWLQAHDFDCSILPVVGTTRPIDIVRSFNHDTD